MGTFFIGVEYPIDSFLKFFNVSITAIILTLIITPWAKIHNIREVYFTDEVKLRKLTILLILVSVIPFITFSVVSTFVFLFVEDINRFKYVAGVSDSFYYSLPFNIKIFILSNFLYPVSYFLIPLHFYYLGRKKYKLSILCFIFSLNIVLYGLTYFSRSAFTHYFLIYVSFLFLLYKILDNKIKKIIKITVFILGGVFLIYFIYISNDRFTNDTIYEETIPYQSFIQDPVLYSYFDYLSQWYYNSMFIMNSYNFNTFQGQISLQPILSILGQYGFINYSSENYLTLRQNLWPLHWYSFNGIVAYSIYDYGYCLTIIFSLIYNYIIRNLQPNKNKISIMNLFFLVMFIQLPLMAIFYSTVSIIVIPLLYSIPIFFYLKVKIVK